MQKSHRASFGKRKTTYPLQACNKRPKVFRGARDPDPLTLTLHPLVAASQISSARNK